MSTSAATPVFLYHLSKLHLSSPLVFYASHWSSWKLMPGSHLWLKGLQPSRQLKVKKMLTGTPKVLVSHSDSSAQLPVLKYGRP